MYITLRCNECESTDCKICPLGTYVPGWSRRGCTRCVDDLTADKFKHFLNERLPFIFMMKNPDKKAKAFQDVHDTLEQIYHAPLGKVLDSKGKAITNKEVESIECLASRIEL